MPTGGCANDSVWSGTLSTGGLWGSAYCDNWTDNASDAAAAFGFRTRKDSGWTAACTAVIAGETFCNALAPIYCFEQ
jgi:hypothetical protein